MKKVLGIAIAGALVFTSCSKDYTCKCSTTTDGVTIDTTYIVTRTNVTKSDAAVDCTNKKTTKFKTCALI